MVAETAAGSGAGDAARDLERGARPRPVAVRGRGAEASLSVSAY